METVDVLLINAHVLTMDEDMHQYPSGAVAIKGDSLVAVGPASRDHACIRGTSRPWIAAAKC